MARLLRMPEVAANSTEAVLQSWAVAENVPFAVGDTIAMIETDKAVVDVEAEEPGVLLRALVAAGAHVEVARPIAVLGDPGEVVADLEALLAELGVTPAAAGPEPGARLFASPLARRMAKEAGLVLESLHGTGPGGRIVRADVTAALAAGSAAPVVVLAPAPASTPARAQAADLGGSGYVDVPHTRMRRAIASRLVESKQTTPHFYVRGTARVDRLMRARERMNADAAVRVSVNDLVIKAVACAHLAVPAMNVTWAPDHVRAYSSVDLSVAVASERGLVTPVLRSVEQMSVTTIAATVRDLAERARSGRLQQHELEGGSFSVTNLGMFGTEDFAAIINPPQAAILAVGAVRQEPVVVRGKLRVGSVLHVTLSADHRPIDGVVAAQWMRVFLSLLEDPVLMLV